MEVVPAGITLPVPAASVRAWALDERGQRGDELVVTANADGSAVLEVGPPARTLWYEVDIR